MNVRELKEILSKYDDNAEVITKSGNYEIRGNYVSMNSVTSMNLKKDRQKFEDDFDYTIYYKDVFVNGKDGDEVQPVVMLTGY